MNLFRFLPRLSLIQKFNLLILLSLVAIAVYLGYYSSNRLREDLKNMYQTYIARQIQLTAKTYLLNSGYFDPNLAETNHAELTEQLKALERSRLQSDSQNASVGMVLYNREGVVIWDENTQRLKQNAPNAGIVKEVAKTGLPEVNFIADAKAPSTFSERLWGWLQEGSTPMLLQMLIPVTSKPIRSDQPGQLISPADIEGVLEVALRPGWLIERHRESRKRIFQKVTIITMLLYIILFWLFYRASSTIHQQGEALRSQQTLTQLGQMAGYLAHEIRNPLFVIRSSAQTLQDEFPADDKRRLWADFIIEEVDRLNALVNDLLGLVRRDQHKQLSTASVSQALSSAANRILAQAPGLDLVEQLAPACDQVLFDQDQLIQVFTNLLRNSRDACPNGGRVEVETRLTPEGSVSIRFQDNGPGIPEEIAKHIFDPFFTRKEGGTGLGLSIVRRLVEANQAAIALHPAPDGRGACFMLTCLCATAEPSAPALPS